jgi:hypothetical protein
MVLALASLLLAGVIPDGLNVVAIGIVYERCIVTGRIVAITRPTVVLPSRRKRRLVERLDLAPAAGFECQVQGHHYLLLADPEVGVLAIVESGSFAVFHVIAIAERRKRFQVEGFRFLEIADR